MRTQIKRGAGTRLHNDKHPITDYTNLIYEIMFSSKQTKLLPPLRLSRKTRDQRSGGLIDMRELFTNKYTRRVPEGPFDNFWNTNVSAEGN